MDQRLDPIFRDYFASRRDDILRDIFALVSIRSVKGEPAPGAPVGVGPARALDKMLEICRREGLSAENIDNLVGEVSYGEGSESVGVLAHLDVVPEGSGWSHPPYEPYLADNGLLYGRGVADNKGPCVISLYALLAFQAAGLNTRRAIKLIFGTDEESGSSCVKRYLEVRPAPTMAFSPDAGFPAVYAEKHIAQVRLEAAINGQTVLRSLSAGTAANVVPPTGEARLSATVPLEHVTLPENVSISQDNGDMLLSARGAPAHASTPWLGKNAAVLLLGALGDVLERDDAAYQPVHTLFSLCAQWDGQGLGIDCADEVSDRLTMNLGKLAFEDGKLTALLDLRLPVTLDAQRILDSLVARAADEGIRAGVLSLSPGLYVPKDSELVSTLMDMYRQATGSDEDALAIGGGTYARLLPCAVAYGVTFPGENTNCHMADECQSYDNLVRAGVIFAHVLAQLAGE
ncbi:MAG: Sapep family Mn(2+)-dependent dipeptidase [Eubacteriales bacterium]|nr:Sapep family Mn(2+)-dependent dipeptidase [Eubacteriales bacterium]